MLSALVALFGDAPLPRASPPPAPARRPATRSWVARDAHDDHGTVTSAFCSELRFDGFSLQFLVLQAWRANRSVGRNGSNAAASELQLQRLYMVKLRDGQLDGLGSFKKPRVADERAGTWTSLGGEGVAAVGPANVNNVRLVRGKPLMDAAGNVVPCGPGRIYDADTMKQQPSGVKLDPASCIIIAGDPGSVVLCSMAMLRPNARGRDNSPPGLDPNDWVPLGKMKRGEYQEKLGESRVSHALELNLAKAGVLPYVDYARRASKTVFPHAIGEATVRATAMGEALARVLTYTGSETAARRRMGHKLGADQGTYALVRNFDKLVRKAYTTLGGENAHTKQVVFFVGQATWTARGGSRLADKLVDYWSKLDKVTVVRKNESYTTQRCAFCASPLGVRHHPPKRTYKPVPDGSAYAPRRVTISGVSKCYGCLRTSSRDYSAAVLIGIDAVHEASHGGERVPTCLPRDHVKSVAAMRDVAQKLYPGSAFDEKNRGHVRCLWWNWAAKCQAKMRWGFAREQQTDGGGPPPQKSTPGTLLQELAGAKKAHAQPTGPKQSGHERGVLVLEGSRKRKRQREHRRRRKPKRWRKPKRRRMEQRKRERKREREDDDEDPSADGAPASSFVVAEAKASGESPRKLPCTRLGTTTGADTKRARLPEDVADDGRGARKKHVGEESTDAVTNNGVGALQARSVWKEEAATEVGGQYALSEVSTIVSGVTDDPPRPLGEKRADS